MFTVSLKPSVFLELTALLETAISCPAFAVLTWTLPMSHPSDLRGKLVCDVPYQGLLYCSPSAVRGDLSISNLD